MSGSRKLKAGNLTKWFNTINNYEPIPQKYNYIFKNQQ